MWLNHGKNDENIFFQLPVNHTNFTRTIPFNRNISTVIAGKNLVWVFKSFFDLCLIYISLAHPLSCVPGKRNSLTQLYPSPKNHPRRNRRKQHPDSHRRQPHTCRFAPILDRIRWSNPLQLQHRPGEPGKEHAPNQPADVSLVVNPGDGQADNQVDDRQCHNLIQGCPRPFAKQFSILIQEHTLGPKQPKQRGGSPQ